jgi:formylglycine-generating enzyme required for sulfatase activity
MVLIPAGDFWMGCNAAKDGSCAGDEKPQHQVTLSAYYMDLDEVTVDDYAGCVSAGGCSTPNTNGSCNWGKGGKGSHPINCVDWFQASAYCAWADKRLPTEAEWEKAARGGCETVTGDCKTGMRTYPWGEAAASCTYAVMKDGGAGCGTDGTLPVGSRSSAGDGPYGLRDMSGNVWEWCADWYDAIYYETSPSQDSKGPVGAKSHRVNRGGSWNNGGNFLRAAYRNGGTPEDRGNNLGFRCARTP